ncbi:uncharacterized protein LOC143920670 [Arctopsyche grandis]|uniref:uncharacterized protein LOC143920670 n=1 Tax=Arctopsyche grandis TaxID=121162 RepID=UPI00406D70F8
MEDCENLPAVMLNSPIKGRCKNTSFFEMPDPSVIAAQRKLELEQDHIASQIISKKSQQNYCADLKMCAPEELALQRKLENNQETIIATIIHSINESESLSNMETQLASDIKTLYSSVQEMKVLSENPGIDMYSVNFSDSDLPITATEYLKKTYRLLIHERNEEDLDYKLNCFLHKMESKLLTRTPFDDCDKISTQIILLSTILLDKKLRLVITDTNVLEVLWLSLEKIPENLKATSLLYSLSNKIVNTFKHFHDRFYIAECLLKLKCDPLDLDTNPRYFSMRLSKYVLYRTLFDLLGCPYKETTVRNNSFRCLKALMMKNDDINALDLYKQYVLMNVLNMLSDMIHISSESRNEELKSKNWILTFFNSMISNHQQASMVVDIWKVKLLCTRINLLWREEIENDSSSQES